MEAATPFQIFSCINLLKEKYKNESADLFLYTYATDLISIAENLKKEKIFKNVYIISDIPQKSRMSLIKYLLFPNKMISNINIEKYEALFISYSGIPNLLLYNLLKKENKNMSLYFYEDGVTSYYKGIFEHSKNVRIMCDLLKLKNDSENIREIFLYEPKLNTVQYNKMKLNKITPISNRNDINIVKKVFSISNEAMNILEKSDIIYFDHDFNKYITKDIFINFNQNSIINNITTLLKKEITVKISPLANEKQSKYKGDLITVSNFNKAPWEMLICGDDKIEEKCLISVCSNAVITPKTVYGKEPYVLILGKMLFLSGCTNSTDVWTEELEKFYIRIRNLYHDKTKFMIPETMDEAIKMVENFLKKIR